MAARVVDLLEVVEVQHHQAERPARARGAAELRVESLLEATPVETTSERVGARHAGERRPAAVLVSSVPSTQRGHAAEAESEESDVLLVRLTRGDANDHEAT